MNFPALRSATILSVASRSGTDSTLIPGNATSKCSLKNLSTSTPGMPYTTTFPSFLAAATVASHSAREASGISFVLDAAPAALTAHRATIRKLIDHTRAQLVTLLPLGSRVKKLFRFRLRHSSARQSNGNSRIQKGTRYFSFHFSVA